MVVAILTPKSSFLQKLNNLNKILTKRNKMLPSLNNDNDNNNKNENNDKNNNK